MENTQIKESIKSASEAIELTKKKGYSIDELLERITNQCTIGYFDYITPRYIPDSVRSELMRKGFMFGIVKDLMGKELTLIKWI